MVKYLSDPLAPIFAALADPTRRAILDRLTTGEASVSTLANHTNHSLPAITKHLLVLERAGLLTRQKRGRVSWCRLEPAPLREATAWLTHYQQFWDNQLTALAEYLEEQPNEQ